MNAKRSRLTLALIFLLFGAPVVVAVLMHSGWWEYRPAAMTNLGQLVDPPRPLDLAALAFSPAANAQPSGPRWAVLYPVTSPCSGGCLSDIENLRQIHRAAGRHQPNLALVLLMPADSGQDLADDLLRVYPVFEPALDAGAEVAQLLRSFADTGPDGALVAGQAFLVDPAGNIMMRYAAGFDPNHLNKDLKRLLKWSAQDG